MPPCRGTGKRTNAVTKQFSFNQVFEHGSTVDGHNQPAPLHAVRCCCVASNADGYKAAFSGAMVVNHTLSDDMKQRA